MSSQSHLISVARSNIIKIDPKARMFSDTELWLFLNEAQEKLQMDMYDDIPEQQKRVVWNITTGIQEYDVETIMPWYKKMNSIDLEQCDISEITDDLWQPLSYCIYGTTMYTNTIPTASRVVKILYSAFLPEITSTLDCVLPKVYDYCLASYVAYLALLSVEKTDKAMMSIQQYENAKVKLITTNNRRQQFNFINY